MTSHSDMVERMLTSTRLTPSELYLLGLGALELENREFVAILRRIREVQS